MKNIRALTLASSFALLVGCGGSDTKVDFAITGLETLTEGNYEGWLVYGDEKVSTGLFKDGATASFTTDRDVRAADKIVITIEPENDADPAPAIVLLAGDMAATGAINMALPSEFTGGTASFVLKTPTDDDDTNDNAGVWFAALGAGGPEQALMLPALPAGFVWEGWVLYDNTPITTGRFSDNTGADSFGGYSGPNMGPPFPGEDFIQGLPAGLTTPVNLTDGNSKVVISVEPDIDGTDPTGAGPFALKPYAADIASTQMVAESIALGAGPATTASAVATISE